MIGWGGLKWIVCGTFGNKHTYCGPYDTIEEASAWAEKLSKNTGNEPFPYSQVTYSVEGISMPVEIHETHSVKAHEKT